MGISFEEWGLYFHKEVAVEGKFEIPRVSIYILILKNIFKTLASEMSNCRRIRRGKEIFAGIYERQVKCRRKRGCDVFSGRILLFCQKKSVFPKDRHAMQISPTRELAYRDKLLSINPNYYRQLLHSYAFDLSKRAKINERDLTSRDCSLLFSREEPSKGWFSQTNCQWCKAFRFQFLEKNKMGHLLEWLLTNLNHSKSRWP